MIEINDGLIFVLAVLALIAYAVRIGFRERAKDRAYFEHLQRISRRCPACQPWGGWYLGKMRDDGSYEVHDCEVCHGTGEVA